MQLTVNSQLLAAELRLVNKIVPTKPAIAILNHALITANGELALYATDLEIGLSTSCHATVGEPGQVALPVAKFLSLVEQFPSADVVIASDKTGVSVRCGAFRSRLQALPAETFPAQPVVEGTASVIEADALRQLIARTRYAVSATTSKYILQGALFTLAGPVGAMVATDTKRLALSTANRTGVDQQFIIPAKAMDMLAGTSYDGDIEVTASKNHLFFAYGGRLLDSRVIDGQFPAYQQIVPRTNDKVVVVDRGSLMAVLRRITLVAEENRATYFSISAGQLEVTAQSAEVGSASEVVAAEYAGEPLKICVNGSYVLDFLTAASGQSITMELKDAKSAMLLKDGESNIGVLMLMRG